MPNELIFSISQEITLPPPAPVILGQVLVASYEHVRVFARCRDASAGSVEVELNHIEVDQEFHHEKWYILDRWVLAPESSVNQVYDVPGVSLMISALATLVEVSVTVDVVMWGYRSASGAPPQSPVKPARGIGKLVVNAMREANNDDTTTPKDNGGKDNGGKDNGGKDNGGKDNGAKDNGAKDNGGTTAPKDNGDSRHVVNAGADVIITLDGYCVGKTDDDGLLEVERLQGMYELKAERDNLLGEATVEILEDGESPIEVILKPFEPSHGG